MTRQKDPEANTKTIRRKSIEVTFIKHVMPTGMMGQDMPRGWERFSCVSFLTFFNISTVTGHAEVDM